MNTIQPILARVLSGLQKQVFLAVVLLSVAIAFRYYVLNVDNGLTAKAASPGAGEIARAKSKVNSQSENVIDDAAFAPRESAIAHAKKHLDPTYVCPMHSQVTSTDPNAYCPICGMKLVLLNSDAASVSENDTEATVTVAPGVLNMLGVRTEQVKRGTLFRRIDSVGIIAYDDNLIKTISLRTEGWIDHLAVKSIGTRIKEGDLLFEVYSPKLVNAQDDFVAALNSGNEDLIAASFGRLSSLGISQEQVHMLERTHKVERSVKIFAPQGGVVSELSVREGSYVEPAAPIINMVDLSRVWLIINIFERQADWVQIGNKAQATLASSPDKIWEGTVDYIYPALDPKTRSLQVRVHFENPDEALKPNMYADVKLFASPKPGAISVPREALIRTGDSNRIIVSLGSGRFKPVRVHVGIETGDRIEILEGLDEGAEVVVSSQFLIDSESSLRAALMRMNGN
ncbi:MAG: efflux RND transporter periplasmic adaptor subunit [Gammaproteobacteria bacterium]|nr:efflux RND transporter periplasmic adaptor subunit [Gammaproteobacteria bacterium]